MSHLTQISIFFRKPITLHLLFWLGIYAHFVGTVNMNNYSGYKEVIDHYAVYVFCQIIVAYTCLHILIPHFLTPKKHIQFVLSLLLLLTGAFVIFVWYHEYYHIPKYLQLTKGIGYDSSKEFWERLLSLRIWVGKSTILLTPTILLVIARFYKEQQHYLKLNEQKKVHRAIGIETPIESAFFI